jgi:hypothetical protein
LKERIEKLASKPRIESEGELMDFEIKVNTTIG